MTGASLTTRTSEGQESEVSHNEASYQSEGELVYPGGGIIVRERALSTANSVTSSNKLQLVWVRVPPLVPETVTDYIRSSG